MFEEDVFEGIRKYERNTCPLRSLVDVLNKKSTGRPTCILEIGLLSLFPDTSGLVPTKMFSPRRIIEHMIEMHGQTVKIILKNPSDVHKFVYKYNSDNEEKEYVFSNNMMFYEDIIIICYLYCTIVMSESYKDREFSLVTILASIMRKKYNIYDDIYQPETVSYKDLEGLISWFRIAYSFPSITFSILYHNFVEISLPSCLIFPNHDLPKVFHSPLLALIIPMLDSTPLSLLMAFAICLDNKKSDRSGGKTPICILWNYIYELYISQVFPISLKLRLCEMWGIVNKIDNEYKFAPYFKEISSYKLCKIFSCYKLYKTFPSDFMK
ncbi:hypothetical protein ALC60_00591 [Trachymyrmex zeteki]|uniref:Uncharacterized protein n=1 Tax=Mycetomoellerius zeteki TaxID=64791 RepID=A0A151XIF0_9HYME|nr:hypothetical protein ALC60_00591 [Trachymyrmex zeteki]